MRIFLASLAILFYLIHATYFIVFDSIYYILWTCHTGCLLVGLGILLKKPYLNSTGFLWSTIGIPLWIVNVLSGSTLLFTSILTHFGGFFIGLYGIKGFKFPKRSWLVALISMIIFAQITKFITPAYKNINLVFSIWKGWENLFKTYYIFAAFIVVYITIVFYIIEKIICKLLNQYCEK